jgi:hypothetical protein
LILFMTYVTVMTLKLTRVDTYLSSESSRWVFNTRLGKIRGTPMRSRWGKPIMSYRGIRYAEPPVGDLKFQVSFRIEVDFL